MKNRLRRHRSVAEHPKHDVHSGTIQATQISSRYRATLQDSGQSRTTKGTISDIAAKPYADQAHPSDIGLPPRITPLKVLIPPPLSTAERIGSLNIFRSSFERYRIGFSARAAPSPPRAPSRSAVGDNVRKRRIKVPSDRA